MNYEFRRAVPSDATTVSEIYNQAIETKHSIGAIAPLPIEAHLEWINQSSDKTPFIVTSFDKSVVAWACARRYSDSPYFDGTVMSSLFVHRDFRGRGLGMKTKKRLMEQCSEVGLSRMLSSCFSTNKGAIALNERLGFSQWAKLQGVAQIDGRDVDLLTFGYRF